MHFEERKVKRAYLERKKHFYESAAITPELWHLRENDISVVYCLKKSIKCADGVRFECVKNSKYDLPSDIKDVNSTVI